LSPTEKFPQYIIANKKLTMKRACLYEASKPMKVLRSECRYEVYFGYAESRKTSVQNEQKFQHAAYI